MSGPLLALSPRRGWEFSGGQVEKGEDLVTASERELLEKTGVRVAVGQLVGVYSNVKSHIVMLDFLWEYLGGKPTTSNESLEVERVEQSEALSRVTSPAIRDRLRDMLEFKGRVIYRAYSLDAGQVHTEYTVQEERHL